MTPNEELQFIELQIELLALQQTLCQRDYELIGFKARPIQARKAELEAQLAAETNTGGEAGNE